MTRIPEQDDFTVYMPRATADSEQRPRRVLEEIGRQARQQGKGIRKLLAKETAYLAFRLQGGKTIRALERAKERTGEGAIQVGKCNQHEGTPWPNVQGMLFHRKGALRASGHGQLLVAVSQVILLIIETILLLHVRPNNRINAIAANDRLACQLGGSVKLRRGWSGVRSANRRRHISSRRTSVPT